MTMMIDGCPVTAHRSLPVVSSGMKQLKWEAQRDDWIQGRDAKSLRRRKTTFQKRKLAGGKPFGKKK